jgi:S1-C subfamily serine protease
MNLKMLALCAAAVSLGGAPADAMSRTSSTGATVVKTGKGELHLRSERGGGVRVLESSLDDPDILRAGDLILRIEDRAVGTPEDIFRVLRALDHGSAARAQVTRQGRSISVRLDSALVQGLLPPEPPLPPTPGR